MKTLCLMAVLLCLAGGAAGETPGVPPISPDGGGLLGNAPGPEEVDRRREELRRRIMALVYQGRWHDAEAEAWAFRLLPSSTGGARERGEELVVRAYVLSRRGRDAEAQQAADRAAEFLEQGRDREGLLRALAVAIRASQGMGDWDGSRERLDRLQALARAASSDYGASVGALEEGIWAYHRGDVPGAVAFWERAFSLGKNLDNPEIRGLAANHNARGRYLLGRHDEARQWFDRALDEARGAPWLEFVVRLNRAEFLAEGLFNSAGALGDLQRAEKLAVSLDLGPGRLWAWNNLGTFFLARGEYGKASEYLEKALDFQMGHDVPEDVGVLINGATLRQELGQEAEADKLLRRALELAQERGDGRSQAGILGNLGVVARRLGYLAEAEGYYRRALELCQRLGMDRQGADLLVNVANLNVEMGAWDNADKALGEALREYEKRGDLVGEALVRINRGYVRCAAGRRALGVEDLLRSVEIARKVEHRPLIFFSLLEYARELVASGDRHQALPLLEEAAAVLERSRSELASVEHRMAFMERRYEVYDLLMDLYVRSGRFAEAFDAAERMKARAFLDVVGGGTVKLLPKDRDLVGAITALEGEVEVLSRKKSDLLAASAPVPRVLEDRLRTLRDKLAFLRSELSLASPELLSLVAVRPLSLDRIQKSIPEGTLVADYHLLADRALVFLLSRNEFSCRELPLLSRDAVSSAVRAVAPALKDYKAEIPYVELSRLYLGLVAPLEEPFRKAERVVVVPQGVLSYVPFQAFWDGEGFLVRRFAISYAPSLSVYALLAARERPTPQNLVGFGNPAFADPAVPPLPFAEEEARQVAALFPRSQLLIGPDATESALYARAPQADVLHLSTHAKADPKRPLNSVILLAPGGGQDGRLTAGEVFGMNLSADCVVLSACETALGSMNHQEGLVGFSRSFFHAGASSLFVSLWSVADEATKVLFVEFFSRWLGGMSKSRALQEAQMAVWSRTNHPMFWAPFILLGREQ